MSCIIENGIKVPCKGIGGVQNLWIGFIDPEVTYVYDTDGSIIWINNIQNYYEVALDTETALFEQLDITSVENNTSFFNKKLEFIVFGLNQALIEFIDILGKGYWSLIFKDNDNNYWLFETKNISNVTATTIQTGKALNDLNGAVITIETKGEMPAVLIKVGFPLPTTTSTTTTTTTAAPITTVKFNYYPYGDNISFDYYQFLTGAYGYSPRYILANTEYNTITTGNTYSYTYQIPFTYSLLIPSGIFFYPSTYSSPIGVTYTFWGGGRYATSSLSNVYTFDRFYSFKVNGVTATTQISDVGVTLDSFLNVRSYVLPFTYSISVGDSLEFSMSEKLTIGTTTTTSTTTTTTTTLPGPTTTTTSTSTTTTTVEPTTSTTTTTTTIIYDCGMTGSVYIPTTTTSTTTTTTTAGLVAGWTWSSPYVIYNVVSSVDTFNCDPAAPDWVTFWSSISGSNYAYVKFKLTYAPSSTICQGMVGFSTSPNSSIYSIQYGQWQNANIYLWAWQSGNLDPQPAGSPTTDILEMEFTGTDVLFKRNGSTWRTVSRSIGSPFYLIGALYGSFSQVEIIEYNVY